MTHSEIPQAVDAPGEFPRYDKDKVSPLENG
jgi:hypothetical protein